MTVYLEPILNQVAGVHRYINNEPKQHEVGGGPVIRLLPWARSLGNACAGLIVLGVLAGCVSMPKQALDPEAAKAIRKIAIVDAREPAKYVTLNFGHGGMLFGAIGGAIAGADMESKAAQFTEALRSRDFGIAGPLTNKVADTLAASGYEVERVPDTRETKDNRIVLDYAGVKTDADAILNVTPTIAGYVSTRGFNDYVPALGVVVELVAKNRTDRLYREFFMYGWHPTAGQWVHIAAPPAFSYGSFDDLMGRSAQAAEGLSAGADLIGERLAQDLGRAPHGN